MNRITTRLIALVLTAVGTSGALSQETKLRAPVSPKIHKGDGWSIAYPATWVIDENIRPPTALKLRGEGAKGFPSHDGTLQELVVGFRADRLDDKVGRIDVVADAWQRRLKANKQARVLGKISQQKVQLTGGTEAIELACQAISQDKTRISYYCATIAAGKDRRVVAVTGYVHFGRASRAFIAGTGLFKFLKAHVASVTVDGAEPDVKKLAGAYESFPWQATKALGMTLEGNRMLRQRNLAQASAEYRQALAVYDGVPAAHQKLAWLHLSSRDPKMLRPEFGLRHALIAVEQTGWLDLASLDALAMGYLKTRQPKKAAEVFRTALKKNPGNEQLQQRLELYR